METTLRTMPCRSCYCLHQFYFFNSSVLLNFLCVRHFSEMHLTTAFYFMLFTIRLFIIYLASIILLLLIVIEKRREKVYLSLQKENQSHLKNKNVHKVLIKELGLLPSRNQNIVTLNNKKKRKRKIEGAAKIIIKSFIILRKKKGGGQRRLIYTER